MKEINSKNLKSADEITVKHCEYCSERSSCCYAYPYDEDWGFCPECKEHCESAEETCECEPDIFTAAGDGLFQTMAEISSPSYSEAKQ